MKTVRLTMAQASWNDGAAKSTIVDFVTAVTSEGGPDYVAPGDRVATFDNDGTLWSEQPYYFQLAFALDRIGELAPQHPEWNDTEPFKSVIAGDLKAVAASGKRGLAKILAASHTGHDHRRVRGHRLRLDRSRQASPDWQALQ